MKIYIIRHGQTDKNKEKLLQGRSNIKLNREGISQCEAARAFFRSGNVCFDKIYSSPLDRAIETAKIASGADSGIISDDRLLEMDYGPYEGTSLSSPPPEIVEFFKDFVNNPAPDGMEPLSEVVKRLGEFLEEVCRENDETILVSTHAIAMKGALEYLSPESKGSYWKKYIGNCAIYTCEYKDGEFTVPYEIEYRK